MTSELKPDLSSFGYADGGYMSKCRHCKETFLGAKRSWSCEPCAIKKSLEPKIEQPKPDVPELVRYSGADIAWGFGSKAGIKSDANGEYVLHSQASEIIAAERQKTKDAEELAFRMDRFAQKYLRHMRNAEQRAEAAEAKLAQYEAQEPVGYVTLDTRDEDGYAVDCFYSTNEKLVEHYAHNFRNGLERNYPGTITPLYASPAPAPAPDLKAENEKLREYIAAADAYSEAIKPNGAFGQPKRLKYTDPIVQRVINARVAITPKE